MKRLLSILTGILAAAAFVVSACAAQPSLTLDGTVINAKNIPSDGTMIAAFYDNNKLLTDVRLFDDATEITVDCSEIKNLSDKAEYVKAFLWNTKTIEPLCALAALSSKNAEPGNKADFLIDDITLNSGYKMPVLGLGTWTQDDKTTANSVYNALKCGYRLIDTAQYYGNERGVGEGVRKAIDEGIIKREDVFVTSKVMPTNYDNAFASIAQSNERLGLDYIDLMLIHQSGSNDKQVYRALEQAVKDGTIRSLGISNYYTKEEFDRITEGAEIMPAVIQNENHPFYQNTDLKEYVKQYGTVVESYYPLGGRGHTQELLGNDTINDIAAAHSKTAAQIILRWHIQAGYITIPGSSNAEHIAENYNIFDFELTADEMRAMAELDTGNRYENW